MEPQKTVQSIAQLIMEQKETKDILELPQVREKWVKTFNLCSGTDEGDDRFETEKIMMLQSAAKLKNTDKFSQYSAFMDLAISGLTLTDGQSYIMAFGNKAAFMPGWKGRLEQICEKPNVVHANEPIVVYANDEFQYTLGERVRIIQHNRYKGEVSGEITHVYFVINFTHGTVVYLMAKKDVLHIRDTYSASYKTYVKDCQQANQKLGSTFKKTVKGWNGNKDYEVTVEPPMWFTDEEQAFKKTIIKRTYNNLPKTKKQKVLDDKLRLLDDKFDEAIMSEIIGDAPVQQPVQPVQIAHQIQQPEVQPVNKDGMIETGKTVPPGADDKYSTKVGHGALVVPPAQPVKNVIQNNTITNKPAEPAVVATPVQPATVQADPGALKLDFAVNPDLAAMAEDPNSGF